MSFHEPNPADIVLGEPITTQRLSLRRRQRQVVRLTPREQRYHGVVFGRSGLGKSRTFHSLFLQLLLKRPGHGVILIDPHHDLSLGILRDLTERGYFHDDHAFDQLVYLPWGMPDMVVPFNVLATNPNPHKAAAHIFEAMLRVFPELAHGAASFHHVYLTGLFALHQAGFPLTYMHQLITDSTFRDHCLEQVSDPLIAQSLEGFARLSGPEVASAKRRSFLLAFDDLARLSLGQPDCALRIADILQQGKSLIIDLGMIEDSATRNLIGALVLVQIEQAALARKHLSEGQRTPCTVLLDEAPSFARMDSSIAHLLEQARKFGVNLVLGAQSPGQFPADALQAALENCRLQLIFGLGRKSAADQAKDLAYLDPAVSPGAQFEHLTQAIQHLGLQEAFVKIDTQPPVKIRTLDVPDAHPDARALSRVLRIYAARYGRTREEAERQVARLAQRISRTAAPAAPAPFRLFDDLEDEPAS